MNFIKTIKDDVNTVFERDPAARSKVQVSFVVPRCKGDDFIQDCAFF